MSEEKKSEKKIDVLNHEKMGDHAQTLVERVPWGGLDPFTTEIEGGDTVYLIDPADVETDKVANGRLFYGANTLAEEIRMANGIIEPITVAIYGDPVCIADLADANTSVLKGNRRWTAAELIRNHDPEWYDANLRGLVPAKFVYNPTPEQELQLRHDQGGQRGLSEIEVIKQGIDLRRKGVAEPRVIELLWNSIVACKPEKQRAKMAARDIEYQKAIDEITAKVESGDLTQAEGRTAKRAELSKLWKDRKDWGRRFIQTITRMASLPDKVFMHFAYQSMPELAAADSVVIEVFLTGKDLEALGALGAESLAKCLARYEQILKERQPVLPGEEGDDGEGEGEGGGDVSTGKAMGRKELIDQAKLWTSESMRSVFLGIAGELKHRDAWPEIDAVLAAVESLRASDPEAFEALLAGK